MAAWLSLAIASFALIFTIVAHLFERSQRQAELALLRRQVAADEWTLDKAERDLHAHISVQQGSSNGGERTDSYTFDV